MNVEVFAQELHDHVEHCKERNELNSQRLSEMKQELTRLNGRLDRLLWGLLGLLVVMVGQFVFGGVPWQ
jgi:hypothetical protein|tara:strand:+ start:326 stop:532 length:207 start_codon:yes stop_codon:yes gene_type:complete